MCYFGKHKIVWKVFYIKLSIALRLFMMTRFCNSCPAVSNKSDMDWPAIIGLFNLLLCVHSISPFGLEGF